MKLNNKGITLTEIIISIALISIVLIFLFRLLVTVNNINKESEVNSTYLINKSLILKNIEGDFAKTSYITVSNCDVKNDIYQKYEDINNDGTYDEEYFTYEDDDMNRTDRDKLKANRCLKFTYSYDDSKPDSNAYLGIYYYKNRNSYVISYIHGNIKATRQLPDFEKYNIIASNNLRDWKFKNITLNNPINGFATITIPIIGSDEKDYSIIISYYGK